jgi:hypothetical protein
MPKASRAWSSETPRREIDHLTVTAPTLPAQALVLRSFGSARRAHLTQEPGNTERQPGATSILTSSLHAVVNPSGSM